MASLAVCLLTGCASGDIVNRGEALKLSYVIDASLELEFEIPQAVETDGTDPVQFVVTQADERARLFIAGYDPGSGGDRDLLLVHISGYVSRLEGERDGDLTLADIEKKVYLAHPRADRRFDIVGEHVGRGRSWLQVNFKGLPHGLAFATSLDENHFLMLSMTMWGQNAKDTALFEQRVQTLKDIVASVRVSKWGHEVESFY